MLILYFGKGFNLIHSCTHRRRIVGGTGEHGGAERNAGGTSEFAAGTFCLRKRKRERQRERSVSNQPLGDRQDQEAPVAQGCTR